MTDHDQNERQFVAEKLAELREKHGEPYVYAALKAASDSLKVDYDYKVQGSTNYVRVWGSIGVDGQVVEIEEIARYTKTVGKYEIERQLRARSARLIVFLEEGIVQPPVAA